MIRKIFECLTILIMFLTIIGIIYSGIHAFKELKKIYIRILIIIIEIWLLIFLTLGIIELITWSFFK